VRKRSKFYKWSGCVALDDQNLHPSPSTEFYHLPASSRTPSISSQSVTFAMVVMSSGFCKLLAASGYFEKVIACLAHFVEHLPHFFLFAHHRGVWYGNDVSTWSERLCFLNHVLGQGRFVPELSTKISR
jgi:hypothetical protein